MARGGSIWEEVGVLGKGVPDAACAAGSKRSSPDLMRETCFREVL